MTDQQQRPWWQDAVIYQIYVRSFADSDGDGVGDLAGITERLDHVAELGCDAIWITPFYTSPQHDHGYDVSDYCGVDKLFGDLAAFDALMARARELKLRVIVDLVPNHTSIDHPWFEAALAAEPGSPERERFIFRPGRGTDGDEPPNNWRSIFGGQAWTRVEGTDQWYLHLFDPTQPDLNWRNPDVPEMMSDVLRFWLDHGVDGFRIDVAHGLFKDESLRDQRLTDAERRDQEDWINGLVLAPSIADLPMWDQPEVHEVYRDWRTLIDGYDGDRMAVAEAWTPSPESMARYVRPDELHQTFNFAWLVAPWSAEAFAAVIADTLAALEPVGAVPTWVLGNHDVARTLTRYGGGATGLARAKAATAAMLALPGSCYLYQGDELGLPQVEVPEYARQDPRWFRTGRPGRDGCRVPIPWSGEAPPYGFSPRAGQPWLPQPDDWESMSVQRQSGDAASTLEFYRRALATRRLAFAETPDAIWGLRANDGLLTFTRGPVEVWLNAGDSSLPLPPGREVLLASAPHPDGWLPANVTVWLA